MNWKNAAADKLRSYDALRRAVVNLPEELERLEQEAAAIRSPSLAGPHIKGSTKREDALINNLVARTELSYNYRQAQTQLRIADRALDALQPEDQLILQRLFIAPRDGNLQRLCEELGVEQSSVYRRRDKALHRFTLAYYGAIES